MEFVKINKQYVDDNCYMDMKGEWMIDSHRARSDAVYGEIQETLTLSRTVDREREPL